MLVMSLPGKFTNTGLPVPLISDNLLSGANGGVQSLFDLSSSLSWSGAAFTDGASVGDISGNGNLSARVTGNPSPTFAGNGMDLTGVTSVPNTIQGTTTTLKSIAAAANQYFLVCGYFLLPTSANWNSSAGIVPFFDATTVSGGYTGEADLVTIAQVNGGYLQARRQNNGSSGQDSTSITVPSNAYGQVAQIAFWRNASGQRVSLTTANGNTLSAATAVGSNNTGNFAAQAPKWGIGTSFRPASLPSSATSMRLYRGFIEDLSVSGRDPVSVLSSDWTACASRFS